MKLFSINNRKDCTLNKKINLRKFFIAFYKKKKVFGGRYIKKSRALESRNA